MYEQLTKIMKQSQKAWEIIQPTCNPVHGGHCQLCITHRHTQSYRAPSRHPLNMSLAVTIVTTEAGRGKEEGRSLLQ